MKRLHRVFIVVLVMCGLLGLAQPVAAQTNALSLAWDQPLNAGQTLTDVQAFTYTLKINSAAPMAITATCAAATPFPSCFSPPIPGLKSGDVLILTGSNGLGSASSDPVTVGAGASKPINVTIIVKVTVP